MALAQVEDYKYYREIDTDLREPVWINLGVSILDNTESDGKDILLYNGVEIPYYIEYKSGTAIAQVQNIAASSVPPPYRGEIYDPENMLDGSADTFYQNDFTTNHNSTSIALRLYDYQRLDRINFQFIQAPDSFVVYGNINGQMQQISTSKTSSASLNSIQTNELRVVFIHEGSLKISGVSVYGETFGRLLFEPTGLTKLYYGAANKEPVAYNTDHLFTSADTPTIALSKQFVNPDFEGDVDGGIYDNCPDVSNPDQTDSDGDGIGDVCDNCRYTQNNNQADVDKDSVGNACDNCMSTSNSDQLDKDLDSVGWVCDDDDRDGFTNDKDNCYKGYNPNQQDLDRDYIGDACEDDDGDGIPNYNDKCKDVNDPSNTDTDKDNIGNACDNCPTFANKNQKDSNNDNIGDVCEDDDDDEVFDSTDNCVGLSNPDQIDWDNDGVGDDCDNCPEIKNANQNDIDRDSIGDVCDEAESRVLENPTIVWSIMIIAAVAIISMAFFLRKPKK